MPPAYQSTHRGTIPKFNGTSVSTCAPSPRRVSWTCLRGGPMPATQPSKELRALCHEHHVEMRLNQGILNSKGDAKHTLAYACAEPDCLVHYNIYRGYFILNQDGNTNELAMVPRVRCPHDGTPMYLAEVDQH